VFFDLQLGQAQNRFYNDLEEWLSGLTKLSAGISTIGDSGNPASAYQAALFEQTAESLDRLQRVMVQNEHERLNANNHLAKINETLLLIMEKLDTRQALVKKMSDTQANLNSSIIKLTDAGSDKNDNFSRLHLRNIETHTAQLVNEVKLGRASSIEEIRQEIRLLARTISVLAEESE
jgi:phage I-like protein